MHFIFLAPSRGRSGCPRGLSGRGPVESLPLTYAMPLGQTDLGQAINAAVKLVSEFPEGSTRLIFFTDGDSVTLVPISSRPRSVKEVLILGLGNPHKGSFIDGHQSRQESGTLRMVATALMGTYTDVNEKHLPTTALGDLVVTAPLPQRGLSLAELAVLAMAVGATIYALIPVALEFFGSDWRVEAALSAGRAACNLQKAARPAGRAEFQEAARPADRAASTR